MIGTTKTALAEKFAISESSAKRLLRKHGARRRSWADRHASDGAAQIVINEPRTLRVEVERGDCFGEVVGFGRADDGGRDQRSSDRRTGA